MGLQAARWPGHPQEEWIEEKHEKRWIRILDADCHGCQEKSRCMVMQWCLYSRKEPAGCNKSQTARVSILQAPSNIISDLITNSSDPHHY